MFLEITARLNRIDELIRKKGTGSAGTLSQKIGVSERTIFLYLNLMRELGATIEYDNYRETYFYKQEGILCLSFQKS